jgi:hypothetical protein
MEKYQKFCYWVDADRLNKVRENVEQSGGEFDDEARIPCRVLRVSREVSYCAPPAWYGFCKRRTSWYWESEKAGKHLIVSSIPFDDLDIGNPIIITESSFNPDRLPSPDEIAQLVKSPEYEKRKPKAWEDVEPIDKDFYQTWFERHRENEPFDFDKIFMSHSANHANFLDPKFFVKLPVHKTGLPGNELSSHIVPPDPAYKAGLEGHLPANLNGVIAPYSVADSLRVCSSCLEFFNILGGQWRVKYVTPCIGAVMFARLPADRYLEVNTEVG